MGQIQARWQTLPPGPRRPRTTNPIPALRGALGPKRGRRPRARAVGGRRAPSSRLHPPHASRALQSAARPRPTRPPPHLRQPSVCCSGGGREKRNTHFPRPPPPERFRFRRPSGTSGVLVSRARPAPHAHAGCGARASRPGSHVKRGVWKRAGGASFIHVTAAPRPKRLASDAG